MGWSGLKNGNLLRATAAAGFDVFITGDQSLSEEQNLVTHNLAVVVLSSIEWRIVRDYLPQIAEAVANARPGIATAVDCGTFKR